jgi:glycerophosphoryl diester phosphodiesterase
VHPFLEGPLPLAFVHRGGAGEDAENTFEAFARAVELGYTYVETDVHATADGVLVAVHDKTLNRVTDSSGRIAQLPWATVATARIGGGRTVPRLVELLDAWPDLRFNVDVKAAGAVRPMIELLRGDPALRDRMCVASFSGRRLEAVRDGVGPGLCTAASPRQVLEHRIASRSRRPGRLRRADCLQVPHRVGPIRVVDARFVDAAHDAGRQVHVWTVDDPAEMESLLDLGVDGLMTDRPLVLLAVLAKRSHVDP